MPINVTAAALCTSIPPPLDYNERETKKGRKEKDIPKEEKKDLKYVLLVQIDLLQNQKMKGNKIRVLQKTSR